MVDWILGHVFVFDDSVMWLAAGLLLLFLLAQYYYLDGVTLAALVFCGIIFVMALKNEALGH